MNIGILPERVPPQAIEAEMAVLGSMMLDKEAIVKAIEILNENSFYKETHRKIFNAILELFDANEPVDIITLSNKLKKKGQLEEVGGKLYLLNLLNTVPSSANVEYYAKITREKNILRRLITAGNEIIESCYNSQLSADELLDKAEQLIFQLTVEKIHSDFVRIGDTLHDTFKVIEQLYTKKSKIIGLPSGFYDLDGLLGGFQKSDFIIIASRPSMGKSSLAINILQHIGVEEKLPVGLFSLEMGGDQVVQRLLCSEARVDTHKLKTGNLQEQDWPKLTTAASRLKEAPIYIDDTPAIPLLELRAKARRLKAKYGVVLILIDYIQLIQGRSGFENRQQEISDISQSLKALAKELNIPIIALSQLSRAVEMRHERRPQLSDLRESGAIEQDADVVLFVYREEYYNPTPENEGVAEIIVGKQRHGPTGTVKLAFIKKYTRFENLAKVVS